MSALTLIAKKIVLMPLNTVADIYLVDFKYRRRAGYKRRRGVCFEADCKTRSSRFKKIHGSASASESGTTAKGGKR